MANVPNCTPFQGGSITRAAYKEESGTERSFSKAGARIKKGNCSRCNGEGWYRIGYHNMLFNDNGTPHECEWKNSVEQVDLKEIPPEVLKQYEAGANEPNKVSKKQQKFYQHKRDGHLYKKKTGRYGTYLNNYKRVWKKKLKKEEEKKALRLRMQNQGEESGNMLQEEKGKGGRVA